MAYNWEQKAYIIESAFKNLYTSSWVIKTKYALVLFINTNIKIKISHQVCAFQIL